MVAAATGWLRIVAIAWLHYPIVVAYRSLRRTNT
jgi:hypothetical protein